MRISTPFAKRHPAKDCAPVAAGNQTCEALDLCAIGPPLTKPYGLLHFSWTIQPLLFVQVVMASSRRHSALSTETTCPRQCLPAYDDQGLDPTYRPCCLYINAAAPRLCFPFERRRREPTHSGISNWGFGMKRSQGHPMLAALLTVGLNGTAWAEGPPFGQFEKRDSMSSNSEELDGTLTRRSIAQDKSFAFYLRIIQLNREFQADIPHSQLGTRRKSWLP